MCPFLGACGFAYDKDTKCGGRAGVPYIEIAYCGSAIRIEEDQIITIKTCIQLRSFT
jgi:hypothetical protein